MGKDSTSTESGLGKTGQDSVRIRRIRVRKEDSAFVYNVLEANEGIASYSTLPHLNGDRYRDLELQIPLAYQAELEDVLKELRRTLEGGVHDLDT